MKIGNWNSSDKISSGTQPKFDFLVNIKYHELLLKKIWLIVAFDQDLIKKSRLLAKRARMKKLKISLST